MSVADINAKTAAQWLADNANAHPQIWDAMTYKRAEGIDPFSELEGKEGSRSPIIRKDDLAKGAGETLNIRTAGSIYGAGRVGEEVLTGNEETLPSGGFQLKVDYVRNATAFTRKGKGRMGYFSDFDNMHRSALADWFGWRKTQHKIMAMLYKTDASNWMYANRRGSRAALRSADVFGIDEILSGAHRITTKGGSPAVVGKKGNNPLRKMIVITPSEACLTLKNSSDYKQALLNAGTRGDENYIFGGGYPDIDGNVIREFLAPDHEGLGPIASALTPKAFLGAPITAGTTAADITGGGSVTNGTNTTPLWFEWFSKFVFKFGESDTLSAGTGDRYVKIVNPDGTYGMCSYDTNNGNKLPIKLRLAPSTAGINAQTVGNVIYGTSSGFTDTSLLTTAFATGATIVECNSYGVPIARSLILGASALVFGYGSPEQDGSTRLKRTEEEQDHGMKIAMGICGVFGAAPYRRSDNVIPNIMIVEHAAEYEGLPLIDVA